MHYILYNIIIYIYIYKLLTHILITWCSIYYIQYKCAVPWAMLRKSLRFFPPLRHLRELVNVERKWTIDDLAMKIVMFTKDSCIIYVFHMFIWTILMFQFATFICWPLFTKGSCITVRIIAYKTMAESENSWCHTASHLSGCRRV